MCVNRNGLLIDGFQQGFEQFPGMLELIVAHEQAVAAAHDVNDEARTRAAAAHR